MFGACNQLVMKLAWRRSAQKKQWFLRQWKGKQYKTSPWEGLHGYYEEHMGVGNYVCRDMIWGVDQGNCIWSVRILPIGPSHDFCQSVIPSWEDGVPKHTPQHSLATSLYTRLLPLDETQSRKVHKTKKLIIKYLLVWVVHTGFKVISRINDLLHLNWEILVFFFFLP